MERIITIPGEPVGKGRPRFTRSGHTYTPAVTENYEKLVKLQYAIIYGAERFEAGTMLSLHITAYMGIPKSATKKKRAAILSGEIRPTKKPDFDNIEKIIADALNGVAYKDDSQIVDSLCKKYYSDKPRVVVEINEIGGNQNEITCKVG